MNEPVSRFLSRSLRAVALAVGIALAFAAISKLDDIPAFQSALLAHKVISAELIPAAGWVIPISEVALAFLILQDAALAKRVWRPFMVAGSLAAAFAVYALLVGVHPPPKPTGCGCGFSQRPVESWYGLCARNSIMAITFAAMAVFGRTLENKPGRVDPT